MELITRLFAAGLLVWFVLLAALIAGRVLRGDIKTSGFLRSSAGQPAVTPERMAHMAIFPVVIIGYAFTALHADINVANPSLPDVSNNFLMLLTGGNGLYLAGKIARTS